jgi:LmbE family N-acetylglucosaminyl deacetylase
MTPVSPRSVRNILCLGCHVDDIEIGCGGTLLRLLDEHPGASVTWVVLSAEGQRRDEARHSAEKFLGRANHQIVIAQFRDRYFPHHASEIKDFVHQLAASFPEHAQPEIIFSHRREDLHQDHQLVAELTWQAFRNHLILEYEIPKYEGDLGHPNVLVTLPRETCQRKVDTIFDTFVTQQDKPWFTKDTFWSLLRLRGLECHSPSGYAEGLYCRKMVL